MIDTNNVGKPGSVLIYVVWILTVYLLIWSFKTQQITFIKLIGFCYILSNICDLFWYLTFRLFLVFKYLFRLLYEVLLSFSPRGKWLTISVADLEWFCFEEMSKAGFIVWVSLFFIRHLQLSQTEVKLVMSSFASRLVLIVIWF